MKTLSELRGKIATILEAEGVTANVVYGRSHLIRRDNQSALTASRVVVAPGNPEGKRGDIRPSPHRHRTERDRFLHMRLVTIQVWGYDGSKPSDEAKQDEACETLFQATMRAVQTTLIAEGVQRHTFYEAESTYPPSPVERVHGALAQVVFQIGFTARAPDPAELVDAEPGEGEVEKE